MAFSVEGRAPFAARSVLNLSEQIPYPQMVRNGRLKWVLRNAFKDLLPEEVRSRPKHGFNVPIDHWLRGEWSDLVCDTFSSASFLYKQGFITGESAGTALQMLSDSRRLSGHTVFCFVMLNLWLKQASNGDHR
jgi:asparagine synthase (glutamine-hydrolysing)